MEQTIVALWLSAFIQGWIQSTQNGAKSIGAPLITALETTVPPKYKRMISTIFRLPCSPIPNYPNPGSLREISIFLSWALLHIGVVEFEHYWLADKAAYLERSVHDSVLLLKPKAVVPLHQVV